jgi:hypothetical protein
VFQLPSEFHPLHCYTSLLFLPDAVADKSTVPESQRCAGTGFNYGIAVTATTGVLVPDAQPAAFATA